MYVCIYKYVCINFNGLRLMPPTLSQVLWVSGNAFRLLTLASGLSADFLGVLWDCLALSGAVWDLPGACPGSA